MILTGASPVTTFLAILSLKCSEAPSGGGSVPLAGIRCLLIHVIMRPGFPLCHHTGRNKEVGDSHRHANLALAGKAASLCSLRVLN